MSPVAVQDGSFPALLEGLKTAPNDAEAKGAAEKLAVQVKHAGLQSLTDSDVISTLTVYANNKKSGFERESAPVGLQALARVCGHGFEPALLETIPTLFELYMDKGDVVRSAADKAVKAILKLAPPEATRPILDVLEGVLEAGKWRTKVGVLKAIQGLIPTAKEQLGQELASILLKIEHAMHDTKAEVSSASIACATALCKTIDNADILPFIPDLVGCMARPDAVPACVKKLASTTFVAEVTAPALAVMVPLLSRALNERSMETQRLTVIVIDNLVKLVRDPAVAARYLSALVPGVDQIAKSASFPEVRAFANTALTTLLKAGASATFTPPPPRDIAKETDAVYAVILASLPGFLLMPAKPNSPTPTPFHPQLEKSARWSAGLVADLVRDRNFDVKAWNRCLSVYLGWWVGGAEDGKKVGGKVRQAFMDADRAKNAPADTGDDEEGELLCDILFSLAYGALLLLNHTTLRLYRGHRYGIVAGNGQGKSTLMKAIRDGKVENFPPQSELRAVMVEHSLQGEDASLAILDFIVSDKQLKGVPRETIAAQLREVGFDDARQQETVGSLSGGWKMKLELARAMLYHADLLLLDEPTNHLDAASVKWLQEYLVSLKHVTSLIVSHDSGFLDAVTTDIMHYETKKLVYYKGNLASFVEKHPEAKSYYTLAATSIKFAFPSPGSLMGVRSNTRAILKLSHCTFAYPGKPTPQLKDVSCALSLSSRVGVIGPNGAGKSTLIKLITGETSPQEGTVVKHPSLRVGYVAQHATHHIDRHLEKTPVQYIQWRYQDGHDRELLEKATRVLTDAERAQLEVEFVGKNGEKRKIEMIMGRQKLKKSLQYEVKWRGLDHRFNSWIPRDELVEKGFLKLVGQFDDIESSREGAGTRETSTVVVRKHLEDVGLDGDIAQYNEMKGLSGGQKVKVVIAAAMWNNPQLLVLDEPTNFLDREALGGLAVAIRDWSGAVIIISHNDEFVSALCPEIWNVNAGVLTKQGKVAVIDEAFLDVKTAKSSRSNTPSATPAGTTPDASTLPTPAGSGAEDSKPASGVATPLKKKKKQTRNQMKAQEERRRVRKLNWLTFGGPKPEDTDSD
ncbi:hypothetical protein DACRYDRAFT_25084 [Dacryopinax primogenitus]|uniref:Elongation factor 3 n=1 Tax=Dacryopinax primogenitus (strain DJM 731) TaxID=1858805 RepID=M5G0C7_DACPD|nr:uncharacterized protein DACRYDRAFT_25084 [Dacryopinax primogenitus]EJT97252.1 hypothetical protein DACRYDRAFT_25084 [Dacryopinax primogenitus]